MDRDNLGPSGPWHIRSVPDQVKQYYVDQAHAERCSVGELLTKIAFERSDASPYALPGADASPDASRSPAENASPHASTKLRELAEGIMTMGDMLSEAQRDRLVAAWASRVRDELRPAQRRVAHAPRHALPAPDGEGG